MDQYAPYHKKAGFTLIELAIVITIISILLAGGLSLSTAKMEQARVESTREKLDVIEQALRLHKEMFGDLPCPARGNLENGDTNFGKEDCSSFNFEANGGGELGRIKIGIVPVRTLNLPDEFMLDGWGRRITYAVDFEYTKDIWRDDVIPANKTRGQGAIIVRDASGNERTSQNTINGVDIQAVYVLISHGKNGYGAWSQTGERLDIGSPTSYETENTHLGGFYDNEFIDDRIRDISSSPLYFDDIVRWKIKKQLETIDGLEDRVKALENEVYSP